MRKIRTPVTAITDGISFAASVTGESSTKFTLDSKVQLIEGYEARRNSKDVEKGANIRKGKNEGYGYPSCAGVIYNTLNHPS